MSWAGTATWMTGRDEDRLADLNAAYADPGVALSSQHRAGPVPIALWTASITTRSAPTRNRWSGSATYLHLRIWRRRRVPGIHGCLVGHHAIRTTWHLLTSTEPAVRHYVPWAGQQGAIETTPVRSGTDSVTKEFVSRSRIAG